ncbi:MAG TPA: DUF4843 domain-containing protein [Candidatus Butyricimonas faecavium]|nr:DUF4843 domain-containing protein [Candidatus Butyricimonas faecavium]
MKKILYYIMMLPIFLSGCEKDLMDYEGLEGVYFAVQWGDSWGSELTWPYQPYTNVQFIQLGDADTATVNLKVMVTGSVKDYDRTFRVEVNPDSTTAVVNVDYLPLENDIVIKAGEYMAMVPVRLIRTEALQHEEKIIGLKLVANQYFTLAFPEWDAVKGFNSGDIHERFDASLHEIRFSDMMVRPTVWTGTDSSPYNDGAESGLWGAFSRKKLEMICERFDLTYNDFMSTTTMPLVLQNLIAKTMSQLLIDRYNAKDPVLEDDGRLMFFSGCPWTSKIGVPWVPDEDYYD